jgi:hypothetical protein
MNTKKTMTSTEPADRPSLLEFCEAILSVFGSGDGHVHILSSFNLCNKEQNQVTDSSVIVTVEYNLDVVLLQGIFRAVKGTAYATTNLFGWWLTTLHLLCTPTIKTWYTSQKCLISIFKTYFYNYLLIIEFIL